MTSKAQKKDMLDYIVERLGNSGEMLEPRSDSEFGIKASYIRVGAHGLVLLIDRTFSRKEFNMLYSRAENYAALTETYAPTGEPITKLAVVFFKDGKTYFKSAAKDIASAQRDGSLKQYTSQDLHRFISCQHSEKRIIEQTIHSPRKRTRIQYYQPESDRLSQALVSFTFRPVMLDYRHLAQSAIDNLVYHGKVTSRENPTAESSKMYIWTEEQIICTDLALPGNALVDREAKSQLIAHY